MLTATQQRALHCIDVWIRNCGVPPTREELRQRLGLKAKSTVQRAIDGLVTLGYLRRIPHRHYAIEVVRRLSNGVQYFRFDDKTKRLVEWQP